MEEVSSNKSKLTTVLALVLLFITLCFGSALSVTHADEIPLISDVNLSVPASCGMNSTLDSPHSATITPGLYKDNIGTTTFNILCNDPGGFALYAIGYTDQTYGKTTLTATINGSVDHTHDVSTSTATSGTTSSWSMKILKDGTPNNITIDNSYDNYNVIPTEYTKVASFTPTTTELISQGTIKSTYASYMSTNQHTGTYDGKVKYTLVHPSSELPPTHPVTTEPGKISYNPNAPGVVDSMDDQSTDDAGAALTTGADVTLWPSNFKRSGYGFAGWNTAYDYSGTTYGPMETITTPDLSTTGLSLYAVWVKSAGDLQGWQGCDSLASGAVTALTDTRDSNTYAVAKLADGKCWMIENLRLGGSSAMNLTTSNTVTAFTLPASTNTFARTSSDYTIIQMSAKNTLEAPTNMTTPTNAEVYSYGNYYSWPAAIGSTTAYSTNNQSVSTSICPAGWHLPKGGDSNNATNSEFWKLGTAIMNNTAPNVANGTRPYYDNNVTNTAGKTATAAIRSYPNNFLYSGYLLGSSFSNRGSNGFYWSSTVGSSPLSYYLDFYSSTVYPGTLYNGGKYYGFSVRCVAGDFEPDPAPTNLSQMATMQEMTPEICAATPVGTEKQLVDSRDNKTYWVAKLQDGKCWMTQNLDLDLSTSKALTPSDSDVTSNWTPTRATINAVTTGTTAGSISGWSNDYNTPYSVDPGNWYWKNSPFYDSNLCYVNSNNQTCNFITKANSTYSTYFANASYTTNGEHGHVGNYYNWSAAVAMNDTSSYTSSTLANPTNNPQTSICPKGWRLPTVSNASYTTNGTTNEFARLANIYANYTGSTSLSSENLEKAPLYFVRSGNVYSSQQNNAGYSGLYWSSSVYSSYYAYSIYFRSDYVNPTLNSYRYYGFSVRCVAR